MSITAKCRPRCRAALATMAFVVATSAAAWAQAGSPPPAQAAPGPEFPAQPSGGEKPGFIAELGRWWDDARSKLGALPPPPVPPPLPAPPPLPNEAAKDAANATQNAVRNAAEATKDAVTAIGRIPTARVVEVRALCPLAPNGAPDCRLGATNACRSKGFTSGDPVSVRSSENCPPAVLMSGRPPSAGECPTETVVLAAACH